MADLSGCEVIGWFEWVWGDTVSYVSRVNCPQIGWFEWVWDVIGWFEWVWGDILWWSLIRKWACTVLHSVCFLCCSLALCTGPGLHCVYFLCFTLCVLCVQKLAKLVEEEKLREEAGFYDFSSDDEAEKELEAQLAKYVCLSGYLPSTVIGPAGPPSPRPQFSNHIIHFALCPPPPKKYKKIRT